MAWFEDGWFNSRWFEAEMTKFNPQIWSPEVFDPDVWNFGDYSVLSGTVNRTASIIGRAARYMGEDCAGIHDLRYFNNAQDKLFTWDNNQKTWTKSVRQRLRGLRNNKWVLCRYFWPHVAVDDVIDNPAGYGVITKTELHAYWSGLSRDLDATDGTGLYIHYGAPESSSNRSKWKDTAGYDYIKFADPDVLDFIFGPVGSPELGWALTNYPVSYWGGKVIDTCDYYGHDVFAPWESRGQYGFYAGGDLYAYPTSGNAAELAYTRPGYILVDDVYIGEGGLHSRFMEYCQAFRTRILDPLGRKLIVNLSQMRHTKIVAALSPYDKVDYVVDDFLPYIDGYFLEDLYSYADDWSGWTGSVTDYRWDLETKLQYFATLLAQGKTIAVAGGRFDHFAFRLKNNDTEGSHNYTIFGNTLRLADKDGNIDIVLTNYASVTALVAYINNNYDPVNGPIYYWTAEVTQVDDDSATCSMFPESPPNLKEVTAQTVTTEAWTNLTAVAPTSPSYQSNPRGYMVSQFAFLLLLGIHSDDNVFLGEYQTAMSTTLDSHTDVHDLLILLGEPLAAQTSWEKVNEAWGDVYCRRYENGVVFFNWEAVETEARTINASDFTSPWYAVRDHVYTPGQTWNGSTSISLGPKKGEICLYSIG